MLEKILTKLIKKVYPNREISVEKIGRRFFTIVHDTTGCNSYLLEGTYSYNDVVKLNELTTYSAGFGFCSELGPVAFIGIPNPVCAKKSGYFKYEVSAYGTPFSQNEYYFNAYTEEEAKHISNYTVYGLEGLSEVAAVAPISKMHYVYDSRYKVKSSHIPKVLDMDCKLHGVFTYNEAKLLATGTIREKEGFSGEDHPIIFATVGEGHHVGIINMWTSDAEVATGFRDVWKYADAEPEVQEIHFLTREEASQIDDFTLYIYSYKCSGIGRDKYKIVSYDRTLDNRFKFQLPDGSDYRLIEHNELFKQ